MGIFSNLFKGKKKEVLVDNNVGQQQLQAVQPVQSIEQIQQSAQIPVSSEEVATPSINDFPAMINTDPSNVLEQMQNRAIEEAEAEAQASESSGDPMDVFNQNISLDSDNPMSVFGVDNQDNK